MKWARAHGCPWDEDTFDEAATHGHLEVLMWMREHGCPWDASMMCERAAAYMHLDVLKWLREQDCSWDVDICEAAARNGHLEASWYS